jgi:cofilin
MISEASITNEALSDWNDMHSRNKYGGIIFRIGNNTEVVTDKTLAPNEPYDSLISGLPDDDCRYAVFRSSLVIERGEAPKIIFMTWSSDAAPVRAKMIYASLQSSIINTLKNNEWILIQATDFGDVGIKTVREIILKR